MLFALRHPAVLLGLALGFAVGCLARVAAERLVGNRRSGLRSASIGHPLRGVGSPRSWLDPFGVVAAVLAGVGWVPRQATRRGGSSRLWLLAATALVVHAALAAVGLAAYLGAGGVRAFLPFVSTADVLHGSPGSATSVAQQVALGFGIENLGLGLLSVVPIPPLETGVAAWTQFPKTMGARRLAYRVLEEQWGVAVILVLLLLPLAGQQPALLAVIGAIGDRILQAL